MANTEPQPMDESLEFIFNSMNIQKDISGAIDFIRSIDIQYFPSKKVMNTIIFHILMKHDDVMCLSKATAYLNSLIKVYVPNNDERRKYYCDAIQESQGFLADLWNVFTHIVNSFFCHYEIYLTDGFGPEAIKFPNCKFLLEFYIRLFTVDLENYSSGRDKFCLLMHLLWPSGDICMSSHTRDLLKWINDMYSSPVVQHWDGDFNWDIILQSQILNSYFYGLVVFNLPAELLAEKFRPHYLALIGMLLSTCCSFLTPEATNWDISVLIYLEITKAVGHALVMPAFSVMLGKWVPTKQLIRFVTYSSSGLQMGSFLTILFGGVICASPNYGWKYLFYYPGSVGLVWCALWLYLCCDLRFMPILSSNRRLSGTPFTKNDHSIPLKKILSSKPFWGYVMSGIATYWMVAFGALIMPSYFRRVFNIEIEWNGLVCSFPYVLQAFVYLLSFTISERVLSKRLADKTALRRFNACIGMSIFATCMVLLTFVGCHQAVGVLLAMLSVGGSGFNLATLTLIPVDMSPNFSGILSGIMNTIGAAIASGLPLMVGFFTDEKAELRDWNKVFYASAFIIFISMILYMAYSSSEIQPWNSPGEHNVMIDLPQACSNDQMTPNPHSSKHQEGNPLKNSMNLNPND